MRGREGDLELDRGALGVLQPSHPSRKGDGKPRSQALSMGVLANKLKNMQTRGFRQKVRHSWGITENYFENIQYDY